VSHSFVANAVHVVFSTKKRLNIIPAHRQKKLWGYMASIARHRTIDVFTVGGTENHVHLLLAVPASMALAKAVQSVKAISSKWMRETGQSGFGWQEGYGAFSVSRSQLGAVVEYINNQQEHHRKHTFEAEFLSLLKKHGIAYDLKYVFG